MPKKNSPSSKRKRIDEDRIGESENRKRRYTAAFVSKLSDSEGEAAETQAHIEFAFRHGYISNAEFRAIDNSYEHILGQLVRMIDHPEKWVIHVRKNT
ncbi:MAG: hypothetical protein C5B58_13025 [Acidobacteria bacterium]|nr:MAG: hypothetical protein C5B58_13025 [Acidobacteriota bacterium]